ncbi:MAG: hypothetical protein M1368_00640 [Thaumarchaeota archaeon]|nr:hypothetical protein [Nitrososphaerota archaeon]
MTGIIVPLYSYPGDSWTRVAEAKLANPRVTFVVARTSAYVGMVNLDYRAFIFWSDPYN